MRVINKRCKHCKCVYPYQASGDGCFDISNSSTYCSSCQRIINKALKEKEPEYTAKWREFPSDEVTVRKLITIQDRYVEWLQEDNKQILVFYRAFLSLGEHEKGITYGFYGPYDNKWTNRIFEEGKKAFYKGIDYSCLIVNMKTYTIKVKWEWNIEEKDWGNHEWDL